MHLPETAIALGAVGIALPLAWIMMLAPRVLKTHSLAPWANLALWIVGSVLILCCGTETLQLQIPFNPPPNQLIGYLDSHAGMFLGGFLAGSGVILVLSGALSKTRESVTTGDTATCVQCGGIFTVRDMIAHDGYHVCAHCKPIFLQKLAEGIILAPPELKV
jgi:hypothetical protein